MRSSTIALLALAIACTSPVSAPAETLARRPNIVLILADDLGWTGLGCHGSDYYETPHIDRLAGQGIRFDRAYACYSVCAPSRASLLSGQFVGRHHVLHVTHYQDKWLKTHDNLNRFRLLQARGEKSLPDSTTNLAESLKKAGYRTGMFGKWHLGVKTQHPGNRGFDVAIESHGKHFGFYTTPHVDHPADEYLSDFLTRQAVKFIRESHRDGQRFFLYFPNFLVHKPLQAKQQYLSHFSAKKKGKYQHSPMAAAMIKSLDDSVGSIMQTLDELGIAGNTVVFFTSDNGGLAYAEDGRRPNNTSNYPLKYQKGSEFDGGLRVPFIVRWTGVVPAGKECHEVVCGADLYPTLLTLAGAPAPRHTIDGTDLSALLRDPSSRLQQRTLIWYFSNYSAFHRPSIVARQGDWKLIRLLETGQNELYHTGKDIGEQHNIAERHPEVVSQLSTSIDAWLADANPPRMRPNPSYDPESKQSRQRRQ